MEILEAIRIHTTIIKEKPTKDLVHVLEAMKLGNEALKLVVKGRLGQKCSWQELLPGETGGDSHQAFKDGLPNL